MSDKTLYQQALEIYHAQETLNSYSVEHDDIWTKWHSGLTPADKHHLIQVAVIVTEFVDELTNSLSETIADERFISEIPERIQRKFTPSVFLKNLGVSPSDNISAKQRREKIDNDNKYQDTVTFSPPLGDSDIEREISNNILETAVQAVRDSSSPEQWFESLSSEEQKVLQESTETVLDLLPEIINSYLLVHQTFLQIISQDVYSQLTPLQRLWRQ